MTSQSITREIYPLKNGKRLRYASYIPEAVTNPPLILCLHPGWSGPTPPPNYGEQFLHSIWLPAFAKSGAILAAPDCPNGSWNNLESKTALLELVEHLTAEHGINPNQISLVGYSAGGWGAWYLLLEHAEIFASAVLFATLPVIDPVDNLEKNFSKCDELLTERIEEWIAKLPPIPITLIHSQADELFPYPKAALAAQALLDENRPVEFITIEGAGHFDGGRYADALKNCLPWLKETWETGQQPTRTN